MNAPLAYALLALAAAGAVAIGVLAASAVVGLLAWLDSFDDHIGGGKD